MDAYLERLVRERAHDCCEYCLLPRRYSAAVFELDHIIAEQHGGLTIASNLAWTCFFDNHNKGPNIAGIDPKTGRRAWLFHPRRQKWSRHFRWDGPILIGKTPVGRATISVLKINAERRVIQRAELIREGVFPPRVG